MKPEEQRIAIAEWCGLKCSSCNNTGIKKKFGKGEYASIRSSNEKWLRDWPEDEPDIPCDHSALPEYLNDLNAMHEAKKFMEENRPTLCFEYSDNLRMVINPGGPVGDFRLIHATAAQRAEALLKTIGRWTP